MSHISAKKYKKISVTNVQDMTPYEQIKIILNNIIGKLAAAKGNIERNEISNKGINISNSISLIGALQDALNMEQGGEISDNLYSLYEYCQVKLVESNLKNSLEGVQEVISIIKNIKEGWDAIPEESRQPEPLKAEVS